MDKLRFGVSGFCPASSLNEVKFAKSRLNQSSIKRETKCNHINANH